MTQINVLDRPQGVTGGYKVDVTRGRADWAGVVRVVLPA